MSVLSRFFKAVRNISVTVAFVADGVTREMLTLLKCTVYSPPQTSVELYRLPVEKLESGELVKLDVRVARPHPELDNGRMVLLLHGFPEYWGIWRPQLPALVAVGFTVLIPDQRGYNESSKPPTDAEGTNYALSRLAQDAFAILDFFAPTGQVLLVGHDFGGAVAWWMAMSQPGRFERMLVASMPHPLPFFAAWDYYRPQTMDSRYIGGFLTKDYAPWVAAFADAELFAMLLMVNSKLGTFNEKNLAPFRKAWTQGDGVRPQTPAAMMNWYDALWTIYQQWTDAPRRFPWPSKHGIIEVPTCCIDGENDAFFVEQLMRPTRTLCTSPGSTAKIIPNENHWFFWDDPASFNRDILVPWLRDGRVASDEVAGTITIEPYEVEVPTEETAPAEEPTPREETAPAEEATETDRPEETGEPDREEGDGDAAPAPAPSRRRRR